MSIDLDALRHLGTRHRETFHTGAVLYRQGGGTGPLYLVLRGLVAFTAPDHDGDGDHIVETVRAGEFFGEVACFGGLPRATTATVQEDNTVLLVLDPETAFSLLAASPGFGMAVIRRLCERVRVESQRSSKLQTEVKELRDEQVVLKQEIVQLRCEPETPLKPAPPRVNLSAIAGSIAEAARSAQKPVPGETNQPTRPA